MDVGIITFHFAHNQGAVLQCYALQRFIKDMGHNVKVINYCPDYHTIRYTSTPNPFIMARNIFNLSKDNKFTSRVYKSIREFAKGIYINITRKNRKREKNFLIFINKNLNLTKKYKTLKSLQKDFPLLDVYVTGSDQLWNPELSNKSFDPAYFLDFGNAAIKKITYAVSLKERYTDQEKEIMKNLCKNLNAISIREKNIVADEIFGEKYSVCVDPTLLYNEEDYESIISEKIEDEPYVFVYGFETSDLIIGAVETISKELGVKVINGSPRRVKIQNAINRDDYGPNEFLSYIKNAEFVITNSFHGTAFSLIFKKKFVTISHTTRGMRMIELLEKLGLDKRIWRNSECQWQEEIDYISVDKKRIELKIQAKQYLVENLYIK